MSATNAGDDNLRMFLARHAALPERVRKQNRELARHTRASLDAESNALRLIYAAAARRQATAPPRPQP